MKKFTVKTLVATGIGAALFFVLARFVSIPTGIPDTNFSIQYGVLAFLSAVYGPIAGVLAGFIGHFLSDLSFGWGVWYSWVIASAIFGGLMGFVANKLCIEDGLFTAKDIVIFNAAQAICHIIAWVVVAPVLDILIYAEPASKVFLQGAVAAGTNIVTTGILGTLLCKGFAMAIPKKGSLKEEE